MTDRKWRERKKEGTNHIKFFSEPPIVTVNDDLILVRDLRP